jgi:hypothetical protein
LLEHKERTTPGGLTKPDELATLLRLSAELGFPHLPDPDAHILPFEQVGRDHVFSVDHGGHRYALRCQRFVDLTIDGRTPIENRSLEVARRWTDEETNVVLALTSSAIRDGTSFGAIVFPVGDAMRAHPDHRLGPLPKYFSAEIIEDFDGDWMLPARDHARWYELYDRMMVGYSRSIPKRRG